MAKSNDLVWLHFSASESSLLGGGSVMKIEASLSLKDESDDSPRGMQTYSLDDGDNRGGLMHCRVVARIYSEHPEWAVEASIECVGLDDKAASSLEKAYESYKWLNRKMAKLAEIAGPATDAASVFVRFSNICKCKGLLRHSTGNWRTGQWNTMGTDMLGYMVNDSIRTFREKHSPAAVVPA